MAENDVEFNGDWYTVTDPQGTTWTFDPDEMDESYIEQNLWAWSRLLDYVKEHRNVPGT